MWALLFAAIFCSGVSVYAQNADFGSAGAIYNYLNGWFGVDDPRQVADDSQPGVLSVHKLILDDGDHWCSAVMIGPQWAVTAAHCIALQADSIEFYRDNYYESSIRIDHSWSGAYYGKFWNVDSINVLYQDYGFVHLVSPAPSWVTFAQIAQPNEVYVGEPAESIGFPSDQFGGNTKVSAGNCGVRRLLLDAILSDCAVSEGNSGGAFLVQTRSGEWKLGAVASTEEGRNDNDGEYTIEGGSYSDALANHFLNITYYSGHIADAIMKYDGEKLATLNASATDPVQCLTKLTDQNANLVTDDEIDACKSAQTQPQH